MFLERPFASRALLKSVRGMLEHTELTLLVSATAITHVTGIAFLGRNR
jgi:hypothetical protein